MGTGAEHIHVSSLFGGGEAGYTQLAQALLQTLCSGITPSKAQGSISSVRD